MTRNSKYIPMYTIFPITSGGQNLLFILLCSIIENISFTTQLFIEVTVIYLRVTAIDCCSFLLFFH